MGNVNKKVIENPFPKNVHFWQAFVFLIFKFYGKGKKLNQNRAWEISFAFHKN